MATTKYLKLVSGNELEGTTVEVSAGAGDDGKIPSLNADGVLDLTVTNGTASSAGAGDADKLVALDGTGRIDTTMMPTGVGAETKSILASETMSAGALGNIYNNAGTPNVRKADASNGREANCFLLASVTSGNPAIVYLEGTVTGLSGLTAGKVWLSGGTPGAATNTPVSTSGYISQRVGTAISATEITFEPSEPITLA